MRPLDKNIDLVGMKFGRYTVTEFVGRRIPGNGSRMFRCRCSCGNERVVAASTLWKGHAKSCGCLCADLTIERHLTHGLTIGHDVPPEYDSWCAMKSRCSNAARVAYSRYGGRGISVCERWANSFPDFLADMGPRPSPDHSLDRIDNDGNYEPGNCRWATKKEQMRNTANTVRVSVRGEIVALIDACEQFGVRRSIVDSRLRKGWTPEQALGLEPATQETQHDRS